MEANKSMKVFSQLQREMQENRMSLLLTPFIIGCVLVVLMLGSVIVAKRVSIIGDGVMQVLMHDQNSPGVSISINVDDDNRRDQYVITEETEELDEEEWNFSGEWTFRPGRSGEGGGDAHFENHLDSLNPVLNGLHTLFLLLLMMVTMTYALGCLYQDRKDRSILFWKSLPVSEWQEVLCKLAVAIVLAPLAFLVASILTQLAYIVLAMLLVWRMDGDASTLIFANIQLVPLILNQIGGVLVWMLWTAPVFAWLMLASALSRRSPFMLAFGVPLALIFVEKVFIGSNFIPWAIFNHVPHMVGDNDSASMGMYVNGPVWSSLDYTGMMLGLVVTGALVTAAVWLRRHRFEI
jgi:ABC-2 type transport system permease protein